MSIDKERLRLKEVIDTQFKRFPSQPVNECLALLFKASTQTELEAVKRRMAHLVRSYADILNRPAPKPEKVKPVNTNTNAWHDHVRQRAIKAGTHYLDKDGGLVSIIHKQK